MQCALEKPHRAKLYGGVHKCEFLKDKIDYLGFDASAVGIHGAHEKVKAVLDWPRPQTVDDIKAFWELASYCQNLLKDSHN